MAIDAPRNELFALSSSVLNGGTEEVALYSLTNLSRVVSPALVGLRNFELEPKFAQASVFIEQSFFKLRFSCCKVQHPVH